MIASLIARLRGLLNPSEELPLGWSPAPDVLLTTRVVAACMMVASSVMVLWHLQDASLDNANTGSRYATIESLVDYGTYHIDKSRYVRTIDKVKVDGHYISSKPATLPTVGAGVYWAYQRITGRTIAENEGQVVWLVSLCTGWLAHVVFLLYLYRLAQLLLTRHLAILGTVAVGGFAYLGAAYATTINNHSTGAALALVGLYHAVRAHRVNDRVRDWVLAGVVFGFTAAVDLTSLAFLPCIGLYLASRDWRRALFLYAPALLPGLVVLFGLNYYITGSFKPTYTNSELKNFPGNYFRGRQSGIDALREPKYIYGFNVLLGHHGLFSMTPVFCFAAYEYCRRLGHRKYFKETLALLPVLAAFFVFYIFRTRNYGGWCIGMRWLMPIMPIFLLYFGMWLERVKLTRVTIAAVLLAFGVSCFHVQDGLTGPFQFSVWHNWLEKAPNRNRTGKLFNVTKKRTKVPRATQ
jgi:Dolichyl-phosphate-mannose-protein mannosyltransferase